MVRGAGNDHKVEAAVDRLQQHWNGGHPDQGRGLVRACAQ
jgi:hypothetical protein